VKPDATGAMVRLKPDTTGAADRANPRAPPGDATGAGSYAAPVDGQPRADAPDARGPHDIH
jgi:hypothetical protein